MQDMQASLVTPCTALHSSYCEYIEELGNEERYPYPLDLDHSNFTSLIHTLTQYSKGQDLPDWMVPNSTYWLVINNQIIGCSHLRHSLNEALTYAGGHIGLGIRPSFRGQGYGKLLLDLSLHKALEKGIEQVHIHCYKSNLPSARLLESVGARLQSEASLDDSSETLLRYQFNRRTGT